LALDVDAVPEENSCLFAPLTKKGPRDVELWNLALAAIFFIAMGTFAGVTALHLTGTRVRLLGHQAAETVLFCLLFAIAVFAVIAAVYP
jgi:hypothetical protein